MKKVASVAKPDQISQTIAHRIVAGLPAYDGQFPWQVNVEFSLLAKSGKSVFYLFLNVAADFV